MVARSTLTGLSNCTVPLLHSIAIEGDFERFLQQRKSLSEQSATMRGALLRSLQRMMTYPSGHVHQPACTKSAASTRHVVQQAQSLADAQPTHREAETDEDNSEVRSLPAVVLCPLVQWAHCHAAACIAVARVFDNQLMHFGMVITQSSGLTTVHTAAAAGGLLTAQRSRQGQGGGAVGGQGSWKRRVGSQDRGHRQQRGRRESEPRRQHAAEVRLAR